MKRTPWIVHLDGDVFAVSVERSRGRLPQLHPALVGDEALGRGTVACASYEARARGVVAGMPLTWARWRLGLHSACVPRDLLAWEEASRKVYAFLQRQVPVVEMAGLDDFFLDLTGCDRWCGGEIGRWVIGLLQRLKVETALPFSAGIARTKFVAQLATRLAKPAGLTAIRPGAEAEFLRSLPLALLPHLPSPIKEQLEEFGCQRVEDVLALGRERLSRLFGKQGEELWWLCQGEIREPVRPTHLVPCVEAEHLFEPDTCAPTLLAAGLRLVLEKLGWELRRRGRRCVRLVFTAAYCDGLTLRRVGKPAYPTDQTHELAALAHPWLSALMGRRVRLRKFHLRAATEGVGADIGDFLEEQRLARTARLYEALDRVRARYGLTSLISATALPALGGKVSPFVEEGQRNELFLIPPRAERREQR